MREMKKEKISIIIWSIIINCMLIIKWTFSIPHTMVYGSVVTIALIVGTILFNKKRFKGKTLKQFLRLYRGKWSIDIYLILMIGFIIVLTGIYYRDFSNIALGLVVSILVPLVHIIVKKESKCDYFYALSIGTISVFIIFIFVSFLFVPLSFTQYSSIIGNPNEMGQYLSFVMVCILYLCAKTRQVRYTIIFDIAVSFVIFSISRTTYLCAIFVIAITFAYIALNKGVIKAMKSSIKNIVIFVAIFLITFSMMTTGNQVLRNAEKQILGEEVIYYAKLYKYDGTTLTMKGLKEYIMLRVGKGVNEETDNNANKKFSANEASSGRIAIWENFLADVHFKGHDREDKVFVKSTNREWSDAHNVYINSAYYYGILTSLLFIFYILCNGKRIVDSFIKSVRKRQVDSNIYIFTLMFFVYFITSMLANVFSPFHSSVAWGFWMICVNVNNNLKEKFDA